MRLSLTSLLCLVSVVCLAQKKLNFETMAPMLSQNYHFAYTASEHHLFAVAGGDQNLRFSNTIQIYDTRLDDWISFGAKALPHMSASAAVYMEDYHGLLLVGGTQPDGFNTNVVEKIRMLELDRYTIKELGPVPAPARKLGLAKDGNTIYMFGGSTEAITELKCSNKLFSYDLSTGHMEMLPDMPAAMETNGTIVEGNLYVFGGYDGESLAEVWKYNIAERKWSALPPLDEPLSSHAVVQYGQYILLVGDYTKNDQLIVYDTESQSATYHKTNLKSRFAGASIVGDYLYVYGGLIPSQRLIQQKTYRMSLQELFPGKEQ